MAMDQADGMCVVGGALRYLNGLTVSRSKRVLLFIGLRFRVELMYQPLHEFATINSAYAPYIKKRLET